jgi:hypothetical protein
MTKPVSTSKEIRKQHSPEFCEEALKLAGRIGVTAATRSACMNHSSTAGAINSKISSLILNANRRCAGYSYREHGLPVPENLLKQDFRTGGPNRKWAGDITYQRTGEGWLYLAMVTDLWSCSVNQTGQRPAARLRYAVSCSTTSATRVIALIPPIPVPSEI